MEMYFIYLAATLFLILGIGDLERSFISRSTTDFTTGEVLSTWSPNPEAVKRGNSKWAIFSYSINGKKYISKNRIQVSMTTKVGDKKTIRYDKKSPEKLYSFSIKRGVLLCTVSVVLFVIGSFKLL